MRRLAKLVGKGAFFAALPLLFFYLRHGERTRLILRAGDKILVVKGWLGSDKWILPGGGIHKGEDPAVAVLRELKEETGIVLSDDVLQYKGKHSGREEAGLVYTYHLFEAVIPKPITPVLQWHEISDAEWLTVDEATARKRASKTTEYILESYRG